MGSGREDLDVRMLGEGRPFFLEFVNRWSKSLQPDSRFPKPCATPNLQPANARARLTPACGPHHHAPGRSRALRDSHAELSRAARERRSRPALIITCTSLTCS